MFLYRVYPLKGIFKTNQYFKHVVISAEGSMPSAFLGEKEFKNGKSNGQFGRKQGKRR